MTSDMSRLTPRITAVTTMPGGYHAGPTGNGRVCTQRWRRACRNGCSVLALAVIAAGCGSSGPKRVPPSRWLAVNPHQHSVVLTLLASGNGSELGAFNGYSRGQVLVKIPTGWRVTVRCVNTDSIANQSCAITDNSLATRPSFPGAATPHPLAGLRPRSSASFTFGASRPGVYRIASLVDNEEIGNGMWDTLQVGGTARPSAILYLRTR